MDAMEILSVKEGGDPAVSDYVKTWRRREHPLSLQRRKRMLASYSTQSGAIRFLALRKYRAWLRQRQENLGKLGIHRFLKYREEKDTQENWAQSARNLPQDRYSPST